LTLPKQKPSVPPADTASGAAAAATETAVEKRMIAVRGCFGRTRSNSRGKEGVLVFEGLRHL
jgi:hypothetical protein